MPILIGGAPQTAGVGDWLRCDAGGYLMTGSELHGEADRDWWPLARDPLLLESSQPGLFVAGDVRHGSIKRVASAVGEGATSIALVHSYLSTSGFSFRVVISGTVVEWSADLTDWSSHSWWFSRWAASPRQPPRLHSRPAAASTTPTYSTRREASGSSS